MRSARWAKKRKEYEPKIRFIIVFNTHSVRMNRAPWNRYGEGKKNSTFDIKFTRQTFSLLAAHFSMRRSYGLNGLPSFTCKLVLNASFWATCCKRAVTSEPKLPIANKLVVCNFVLPFFWNSTLWKYFHITNFIYLLLLARQSSQVIFILFISYFGWGWKLHALFAFPLHQRVALCLVFTFNMYAQVNMDRIYFG